MKEQINSSVPSEKENVFFNPINLGLDQSIINSKREIEELTVELNSIRFTYENEISNV
jgi:hypothetical protein